MKKQQVFISYRHENSEHAHSVRKLAELLRQAQLPVMLDQFYMDENPGGPDDGGWPKWCEDQANQSACVIIIASEGWFAAYDNTDCSASGYGAATEAHLFRQSLYDSKNNNSYIRLAFLHEVVTDKVPERLRAWHQFHPFSNMEQANQLIRWAANCLGITNIEIPIVSWPEPTTFVPDLADRKHEWPIIKNLLAGQQKERIVLIKGDSGLGKSALLRETKRYARQLGLKTVWIELKGGTITVDALCEQFDLDLDGLLPNFSRDGAKKTHLLRKDLRVLRQPIVIVLDTYEAVEENPVIVDWIKQQLLNEVETSPAICVIIAGQKAPEFTHASWFELVKPVSLQPIHNVDDWQPWVERCYPGFFHKGADLHTALLFTQGNPGGVASFCKAIAGS